MVYHLNCLALQVKKIQTAKKLFAAENLGKTFNKLNEEQKVNLFSKSSNVYRVIIY